MREQEKELRSYFLSSSDALAYLNITRQHLNSLAKREKITRVKKVV
ncbi:hypothetical protein ACTNBL_01165 [Enterococcus villorum]|uniref:Uncharacterized protein n=2 Tax=Enterococcus villorum TaxID=112904 RepID=A0A511J4X1_9ENTE|nr:hypothetical protein [Enterococcus villorum]EOH92020.1 hypothetical protein UAO_00691 [Enterococcus villorum ATCC 700913]EOW76736.1 hypothetical protein I591_02044 [Enterococcus villorum ATCC 700913]GEL93052.1 hypothetical protein EVI01_23890 [Enterococcus villorum]